MSHSTKCIYYYGKKPNTIIKYKWEGLRDFYKATFMGHSNQNYLIKQFENKGFWKPKARHVHWKIRYQGAKYPPKIKGRWSELETKGTQSNMYGSFTSPYQIR